MAAGFLTPEERPIVEAFSAIPYTNPFTPRRPECERLILDSDYRSARGCLLPGEPLHRLEGNLGGMLERAEALIATLRERLGTRKALSARDRDLYEGLAHFVVFHRHAPGFDRLIGAGERLGVEPSPVRVSVRALFERCHRDFEHLLSHPGLGLEVTPSAPRWFAFYFQVRRAWVNIHAFIHGGSACMERLRARIWQSVFTHDMRRYERSLHARMSDITTLITGPSGSGKELVARAIGLSRYVPFDARVHAFAADFATSFHPLNLSALSPTLIESELFGHRRGAYTGALGDREGYLETCGEHGTVFLDEIGETAPEIQVKLLRVLQTRQFNRLGDAEMRNFRGRVVAATNRDLPAEIRAGRFREDFFFRLCADQIETPPLREMLADEPDELPCLVAHICASLAGLDEADALASEVLEVVRRRLGAQYAWPGNFRELEQCVRNVVVHGDYRPPNNLRPTTGTWIDEARDSRLTMDRLLQHYCRQVVDESGSLEEAARRLAADRRTVRRYLRLGTESKQ